MEIHHGRFVWYELLTRDPKACHESAIGHRAWNELATSDYDAALEFYTGEFRRQRGEMMGMGALGTDQLLSYSGQDRVGIISTFEGGPPPMRRCYFRVPELPAAIGKMNAAGGTVIHGPQEVPGDDEAIVAPDPRGTMFCLVARSRQ
jgi:predicted enzyme related to lactoylglutathione lyase